MHHSIHMYVCMYVHMYAILCVHLHVYKYINIYIYICKCMGRYLMRWGNSDPNKHVLWQDAAHSSLSLVFSGERENGQEETKANLEQGVKFMMHRD